MSRYGKWSEARISTFEKEGRGKGTGAIYQPWLEVTNLSSRGDSRRVFSTLTNRTHHLMSGVEFDFFVLAEFTPGVIDIREQYPLDRDATRSIAANTGIAHPRYPDTTVDFVMTCDFLLTREGDRGNTLEAYNCKSASLENDKRSLEKLEIQRRYFESCGVPHFLVFDQTLPATTIKNIKWIREGCLSENELEPQPDYYRDHSNRLLFDIGRSSPQQSLAEYCQRYDARTGANEGTALRVVRMLLRQRLLVTDLNQPDLWSTPIGMFTPALAGQRAVGAA